MIIIHALNQTFLIGCIALVRPKHWLKNLLIFVPAMYSYNLFTPGVFFSAMWIFVIFCIISSTIYVLNDVIDVKEDREHPIKCKRPIASGKVTIRQAVIIALILFTIAFLLIFMKGDMFVILLTSIYILLNLAFSFKLKHYAIVDCFCIAMGFILRIFAGGAAINDIISEWLFLTIMAISLFMAFGKRRGEIMRITDTEATRKVLSSYNFDFLNGMIFACAGLSIVFYSLWAMLSIQMMIYTVPLVIFIICKYLLIAHNEASHGDPTSVIFGDKGLIIAIGIFGLLSIILLYM